MNFYLCTPHYNLEERTSLLAYFVSHACSYYELAAEGLGWLDERLLGRSLSASFLQRTVIDHLWFKFSFDVFRSRKQECPRLLLNLLGENDSTVFAVLCFAYQSFISLFAASEVVQY